jgi:putative peptidoglycan lipid II flippase
VRRVLALMLPVTLTIGLVNVNFLVDTLFASRLLDPELAPAAIDKAFRLYMLPQGIFAVAVTTVLFPTLARLSARGDEPGLRRALDGGLRQIAFLLVPASVAAAVLAEPIVRLVYERGEFTSDQTPVVAGALAAFSLGLTFNGAMLMLNRTFFSLQLPWLPTWVAVANLGVNAAFDALFYRFGVWGIPLATSVVNVAGTGALLYLLRRRLGHIELRETGRSAGRIVLASCALAAVAFGVWYGLDAALGRSLPAQIVSVSGALAAGGGVYLLACRLLGVAELQALLSLRRGRS